MGFNLGSFLRTLELIGPAVLAASGVPAPLIPLVVHGMSLAEQRPVTGAEKKALALDAVATGVAGVNAAGGHVDPNVTTLVSNGIDTVIGTVNAIHSKGASVSGS